MAHVLRFKMHLKLKIRKFLLIIRKVKYSLQILGFTERFTKHAADENKFPGTRIKQLMTYMWGYKGPVMMNYGTEIAVNGSKIETINQLQNFRTDKEVIKYLEKLLIPLNNIKCMKVK